MTYASTPPGMRASTRMSTREKALKQLRVKRVRSATHQYVPVRTRQPEPLPNQAGESSTWNWREFKYAARDADEEASAPELWSASPPVSTYT